MNPAPELRLSGHARNVHSQFGEDGIIENILSQLPVRDKWCVEFGAWDGRYLSNTCRLIDEEAYSAVLIEGDAGKFRELQSNFASNPKVTPLHQFVGFESNTLDEILAKTPIPRDFDFISIDIDGCDYHIWKSLEKYHPKVVCIEFNPTIPNGLEYVQAKDFSACSGASLDSLVKLGKEKGYELVATTLNNGLFVQAGLYPRFGLASNEVAALREDTGWVTHLISGYDGSLILLGHRKNPWNGIDLTRMTKQLPAVIRIFPAGASLWRRKLLGAWKKIFRLNG